MLHGATQREAAARSCRSDSKSVSLRHAQGKAARKMVQLLQEQPEAYKGKKILFVHTGGFFSLFGNPEVRDGA